ncbi:DUF349 domain-containing protein [Stagnimonas aquatica]|uniref:DUF349 domain-containing protein n=1 Tax=Stagnimonas aquatica TaxID=2689987 RepID=A0A3N0VNQ0_9GAMM|nr:DUF349 domain-containing protein [Stagnimonas aquatica]ROH93608.1 DUF349 domain-containing protein [Stagnimonas aquatica]
MPAGPDAVQVNMSLFSRWFRKAPSLSSVSPSAPAVAPSKNADPALAKPNAAQRALAAFAEEKALQSAIDARDFPAVARLVVAGSSTRIRQAAAQAVEDPDLLRQLIREVRGGNDKNVYKILSSKREALLEQARQQELSRAEISAASEAIERHSRQPYEVAFGPRLTQLETRWEAVAAQADAELQGRVQQWIARARETIAEQARQVAAEAARAQAAAEAVAEARRQREQEAQASASAAAEQARLFEDQTRALAEQQQAEQQALREIAELIRKARAALSDGGSARAASLRRTIEEKRAGAPPLPDNLASQLQQLDKQLDELKDWKSFSVTPKRAELIEAMEALIDAPLEPLTLADRIKNLQDEWRTLGKGAGESADADWQRFHEAAQKAYQPCREYFAAQALVREENLRRRETLLAELTAFEAEADWERPDWQAVIKTLRETKQAWRNCSPVDPQAAKPQQARFTALVARLQDRLDAEYARNQKQKEALIERAQALLASDDGRKAIDGIKALQQQWRTVGLVPREVDQRLWSEFRQHCDAVFQKRDQEFAAYTAGLEDNKAQAIALCEQLEQIAALEGAELLAQAGTLGEMRNAFEALGEFPRADTRELRGRFERGLERCRESVARQHAREAERAWNDLFEAANQIRAYRLAGARAVDSEQVDALKKAAETFMASVQRWPRDGLDALQQALAGERSADPSANEAAARLLCIRAEILADLPTPPEDQALRRDYQLQRLVQGMGQRLEADESRLDTLAIEWLRLGPVDESVYAPLLQRFRRCREQSRSHGIGRL